MKRVERTAAHAPNVAKPGVAWDDVVQTTEMVVDDELPTFLQIASIRHSTMRVTAEFMRDAMVTPLDDEWGSR